MFSVRHASQGRKPGQPVKTQISESCQLMASRARIKTGAMSSQEVECKGFLPILLDEGLMCKEEDILDMVVCLVVALGLLLWLARVYAFHNTELPVHNSSLAGATLRGLSQSAEGLERISGFYLSRLTPFKVWISQDSKAPRLVKFERSSQFSRMKEAMHLKLQAAGALDTKAIFVLCIILLCDHMFAQSCDNY